MKISAYRRSSKKRCYSPCSPIRHTLASRITSRGARVPPRAFASEKFPALDRDAGILMCMENLTLHIPQGINYECQSCGKCCGGWAVPMTEADYDRIVEVDWQKVSPVA